MCRGSCTMAGCGGCSRSGSQAVALGSGQHWTVISCSGQTFCPAGTLVLHTGPSTAVASTPRSIPGVKALGLWFCFAPGLAAVTNPSLCLPLYDNPLRLVFSPSL